MGMISQYNGGAIGDTMDADDGTVDQVAMETLLCNSAGTGWLYGGNQATPVTTVTCTNMATTPIGET